MSLLLLLAPTPPAVTGTAAGTAPRLTAAAVSTVRIAGTAVGTLVHPAATATAQERATGQGAAQTFAVQGSGTVAITIPGAASGTLAPRSASAQATEAVAAGCAAPLILLQAAASGDSSAPGGAVTGSGAASLPVLKATVRGNVTPAVWYPPTTDAGGASSDAGAVRRPRVLPPRLHERTGTITGALPPLRARAIGLVIAPPVLHVPPRRKRPPRVIGAVAARSRPLTGASSGHLRLLGRAAGAVSAPQAQATGLLTVPSATAGRLGGAVIATGRGLLVWEAEDRLLLALPDEWQDADTNELALVLSR